MKREWIIRPATSNDANAILDIKNHAIVSSSSVYDELPESLDFYESWLRGKAAEAWPVFIICPAEQPDLVAGYASYGPFRHFAAYRYTVENSLYIHRDYQQLGLGRTLLKHLVAYAGKEGYHLMVAVIDSENKASCHLHEQLAFTYAGRIEEAGQKFGQWLDIVFYTSKLDN